MDQFAFKLDDSQRLRFERSFGLKNLLLYLFYQSDLRLHLLGNLSVLTICIDHLLLGLFESQLEFVVLDPQVLQIRQKCRVSLLKSF
jgi:hypothetical protein